MIELTATSAPTEPKFYELWWTRICGFFKKKGPGNLHFHAIRELRALGYPPLDQCEDGPNKWIQENLLELLSVFSKQGHSGFSAPYCIEAFSKLASFKPLCPLTGADDEWLDVSDKGGRDGGKLYQNMRCSSVFKDEKGAWNIDGVVFKDPNGSCFTGFYSRSPVVFPYVPKTVYADVPLDATDLDIRAAAELALATA